MLNQLYKKLVSSPYLDDPYRYAIYTKAGDWYFMLESLPHLSDEGPTTIAIHWSKNREALGNTYHEDNKYDNAWPIQALYKYSSSRMKRYTGMSLKDIPTESWKNEIPG